MAATSPVDDTTLGSVPMGTDEHVDAAVSATAGAAPELRNQSVYDRAYAIRAAMDALERRSETIVDAMAREVGKPVDEAREELESAIDSGRSYAEDAVRLFGEGTPSKSDDRLNFTRREPYGPAAVVTPWNYPVEIPVDHISAALVTGNPVTWNPASEAALTASHVARSFAEAPLPDGAFNLVPGSGSTVGAALIDHEAVRLVASTPRGPTAAPRRYRRWPPVPRRRARRGCRSRESGRRSGGARRGCPPPRAGRRTRCPRRPAGRSLR